VVAELSSFSVAHYFALALDRLRSNISPLAPNDAFDLLPLVEIKPEHCLVASTFPPYPKATYHVAMWAGQESEFNLTFLADTLELKQHRRAQKAKNAKSQNRRNWILPSTIASFSGVRSKICFA